MKESRDTNNSADDEFGSGFIEKQTRVIKKKRKKKKKKEKFNWFKGLGNKE